MYFFINDTIINQLKTVSSLKNKKGGMIMPNALLVYPAFRPSYWGMNYATKFLGKKSTMPPLGLLTIAGIFPEDYELRLVDMNLRPLTDEDLQLADVVLYLQ